MARCSFSTGIETFSGPLGSRPRDSLLARAVIAKAIPQLSAVADAVQGAQVGENGGGGRRAAFVRGLC